MEIQVIEKTNGRINRVISEEDKKLLLVAAAYHDSGKQGLGDGKIPHAKQILEQIRIVI